MRKIVFAIMILFVVFSVLRGVADTTAPEKIARAQQESHLTGM